MYSKSSILIKDCWLADGTGKPLVKKMVLLRNERIAAIEDHISSSAADIVVGGKGAIAAPGFIDAHGHSELSILARPEGFSKITQGVSTEIVGNCGLSAFPVTESNREHLAGLYKNYGVEITWSDYSSYLAELKRRNVQLKIHSLCGHNTLRAAVAGYESRELTPAQFDEMEKLLETMLRQGAPGLSTGLLYVPGKFAGEDEILFLMKILARHGKLYTTHLRSEGNQLLESLYETFSCARNAALKQVHISHFKTAGKANWHKLPEALKLFEEFRSSGMEITADRYPYTESMTQLSIVLPGEWEDLDDETIQQRLAEPETAQQAEELLRQTQREWDKVRLIRTTSRLGKDHAGKTIAGIAALHQLPPESAVIAILREDASGSTAAFQGMSPDNLKQIIAQPFCCCGSDENARPPDHSIGTSHPRGFGSLPRFLKFRLESGATIPEAVHQVTGLPAGIFQLADTGILAAGNAADIVLFDPDELDGCCDFTNPHTPASGIKQLFINGKAQL